MPIVITDDDAERLLSIPEAIEAMRVAFRDLAEGKAVNPPRLRYSAGTPDPTRRYFANIHAGAVRELRGRLRARRLAFHADANRPRPQGARRSERDQLDRSHPLRSRQRRTARLHARVASLGLPRRRHHRRSPSPMRAPGRRGARAVRHRQPGAAELPGHLRGAADQAGQGIQPERRASRQAFVEADGRARRCRGDRGRRSARGRARRAHRVLRHQYEGAGVQRRMAGARPDGRHHRQFRRASTPAQRSTRRPSRARATSSSTTGRASSPTARSSCLEPIEKGIVKRENVHELGDVVAGKVKLTPRSRRDHLLQEQYRARDPVRRLRRDPLPKLIAEGTNRTIPKNGLPAVKFISERRTLAWQREASDGLSANGCTRNMVRLSVTLLDNRPLFALSCCPPFMCAWYSTGHALRMARDATQAVGRTQ